MTILVCAYRFKKVAKTMKLITPVIVLYTLETKDISFDMNNAKKWYEFLQNKRQEIMQKIGTSSLELYTCRIYYTQYSVFKQIYPPKGYWSLNFEGFP